MTDNKITFGITSKGKSSVLHNQYEFVKHHEYVNGNIQWRCKRCQNSKCQARLTTTNEDIVGGCDPHHNYDGNKENILARQAVAGMKNKMGEISATTTAVIGSVCTQLQQGVLMPLPKKSSLKRTMARKRLKLQSESGSTSLPPAPTDTTFDIPEEFQHMILYDSGSGNDRVVMMGSNELLDGLARAKLWLPDVTFKVLPSIFFQLYAIHFELVPGINPVAVYCLVQNKTRVAYDRIMDAVKGMIPIAEPDKILVDFESAAINSFRTEFPSATVMGCYFHLTQSVNRKVTEIGMKVDYERDDSLRTVVRSLPSLAMVPGAEVTDAFLTLADDKPDHDKMPELLSYFEHTYVRGRRRPGRGERYGPAVLPIEGWKHLEIASEGLARTTNSVEGWHYGLQALFQWHHPRLWTFMKGIAKDMQMQRAAFLQGISGAQSSVPKRYTVVKERVKNAVDRYSSSEILVYLRAIAHLSYY